MSKDTWISIHRASKLLECHPGNLYHLVTQGFVRRKLRAGLFTNQKIYIFNMADIIDYKNSKRWQPGIHKRKIQPAHKSIRQEEDQPKIKKDINDLVDSWNKSKEKKAFKKRWIYRGGKDDKRCSES